MGDHFERTEGVDAGQTRASMNAIELAAKVKTGDLRALSRLISLIENRDEDAGSALDATYCMAGRAHIIGVTGAPGAGKSTLICRMGQEFRRRGKTVGVIAVDPSSALSQGAILADRLRMTDLASDPTVFIRSMATRGAQGGLANTTLEAINAVDAAGFDTIIVETVGVGQDEIEIAYVADTTIVVSVPGLGDAVQAIKAGLLEMADIHVVNKADRPDADRTVADLKGMLSIVMSGKESAWKIPVIATSAEQSTGITELVSEVEGHRRYLQDSGAGARRRARYLEHRLWRAVEELAVKRVRTQVKDTSIEEAINQVIARQISPRNAAGLLLGKMLK